MGKFAPDIMMDAALQMVSGSTIYVTVCSGSPLDYTAARTTNALAGIGITSGCFSIADGSPNGRSLTIAAKTSASITASGSALAVCLLSSGSLMYVTTCTQQYLVSGGTVDIPSWTINIADPT